MTSSPGAPSSSVITPPVCISPNRPLLPLTTEPRNLRFSDPAKKSVRELRIVNTGTSRMTWRVLSNAPRLYLVNPNKGFVGGRESMPVTVTLIDTCRFAKRHQLIVQMKTAEKEEIDREDIWKRVDQRPVSNLRVLMSIETREKKSSESHLNPNFMPSPNRISDVDSTTTAATPTDPLAYGEFLEEIRKLNGEIQKALEEKSQRMRDLTKAVNDVKMLEQELDKETNRLFAVTCQHEHLLQELAAAKKKKNEEEAARPVQSQPGGQ